MSNSDADEQDICIGIDQRAWYCGLFVTVQGDGVLYAEFDILSLYGEIDGVLFRVSANMIRLTKVFPKCL